MQTKLPQQFSRSSIGQKADNILRSCVHCGFCLATCPTYQLLGDELDSPRGRIYLIKSALEDNQFSRDSLTHLDRCLTCRACETTCPSGVEYGELVDIGRTFVEHTRPLWQRVSRYSVRKLLTNPSLFNIVAPLFRQSSIQTAVTEQQLFKGRVLLLTGCVQPALAPNINHATKNVLATLGFEVVETAQKECCGAVDQHTSAPNDALIKIKQNIDQWSAHFESGIDVIISTASGCGLMVKDYVKLFEPDDAYYQKAVQVSEKTKDIAEFLLDKDLSALPVAKTKITFQAPCSLQHGQKLPGLVEGLLTKLGYELRPVTDAHLCCGSAGTYSLFQPAISTQLRTNKLQHLTQSEPDVIVTANIGCQMHLSKGTKTPIKHWIELLDDAL
ncbi:MAG: glycolate oxidase subunit GlcF [Gammaproteobacteria bacterium]|nr:glycolate oxidase subunit GlcF [Gammaproteobacteria bacterium]MDH5592222.1 glycolate oxidase subunit GlcF [Gammaproteobacteria bacterium]